MILAASSLLCLALLHFLWQGAAIASLTLPLGSLARRFSTKTQSASAQYLVLCAGLLAMPIAFGVTLAWLVQSSPAATNIIVQNDNATAIEALGHDDPLLFLLSAPMVVQTDQASTLAATAWRIAPPVIAVVYVLAVLALSGRLFFGLCGARRLVRESAVIHEEKLLDFLADQCQLLNLDTVPVVAYCRDVAVPTVIGVLRPTILLPLAATTAMTTEEIETILTHELVHIRRLDHMFVLVQRLLEAVFFFHPAVWLLSRRISDVREHCCDDRVIALGIEPQVYVESLLRAAELSLFGPAVKPSSSLAIALCAVDQPSRLRERVLRLVNQPTPAPLKLRPVTLAVAIVLMMVAIATPLAVQSFAQQPAEPAAKKTSAAPLAENSAARVSEGQPAPSEESKFRTQPRTVTVPDGGAVLIDGLETLQKNDLQVLVDWIEAPASGASKFRGQFGSQFEIEVAGNASGSVWGTDVYTDDSDLGTAAVHAGLLKPGETGTLILTVVKSPAKHVGSSRNGVESRDYGTYGGSFMLHRSAQTERRPNTTAEDAQRAIRVLDRLTEQKWTELAVESTDKHEALHNRTSVGDLQTATYYVEDLVPTTQTPAGTLANFDPLIKEIETYVFPKTWAAAGGAARIAGYATNSSLIVSHDKEGQQEVAKFLEAKRKAQSAGARVHGFLSEIAQAQSSAMSAELARIHGLKTTDCRSCHRPTPTNALSFRGKLGRQFDVEIVGSTQGSIWGTDIYTDDSHIATAAVHAGLVKPGEHATVTVTMVESPEEHVASERNGVKSQAWGEYSTSYILTRKSQAARTTTRPAVPATASGFSGKLGRRFEIEVVGQTDGSVWGTDVYTDDSHIATAAVHAGLVKEGERAIVTLTIVESPEQHRGTTRNGVSTRDYGSFRTSFILQRASSDPDWPRGRRLLRGQLDRGAGDGTGGAEKVILQRQRDVEPAPHPQPIHRQQE